MDVGGDERARGAAGLGGTVGLKRIALGVEYHGGDFLGWQSQPCGNTVQDTLEAALARIAGHPVGVLAAGRTDAGVHATGQVVHFDTSAQRPLSAWVRGVNAFLPPTVAVRWAHPVSMDFHARFSAFSRAYCYRLLNRPVRPALAAGQVGWYHAPLSLAAMQEAASLLLGTHDFSSFRAAACQAKSPVKTLSRFTIHAHGDELVFQLEANAFLHHMVRNLVGALVYIGKGHYPPHWILDLLAARNRTHAPPTFMPDGLCLVGVGYPAHFRLPSTAPVALNGV